MSEAAFCFVVETSSTVVSAYFAPFMHPSWQGVIILISRVSFL